MFEVFSVNLKHLVNADDVADLSDIFKCPNCDCNAQYTLKAIDSTVRRKHFGRKRSTPHITNCPYDSESYRYIDNENLIKCAINDIYENDSSNTTANNKKRMAIKERTEGSKVRQHIRTPKQLFNYCISNSIQTIYKDDYSVGDIFIDERNIYLNGNFKGKSGLYFILGKTRKFDPDLNSIEMSLSAKTPNNKNVSLNITIILTENHRREIVDYILETFHNFAGHSIAVLGKWECDKMYHVKCEATPGNVIYKFANEI